MSASYLKAHQNGRLRRSIERSQRWLARCTLCPRFCRVDRTAGEKGACHTGQYAVVASYGPHYGEERPLVGHRGSGTIFFSYCNLSCVFCQNYEISHGGEGAVVKAGELAEIMLVLQSKGCHNINLVTPSHVIPQILEALPQAIEGGLRVPLVYNCGGYDRGSALRLLEGIVDIYMPDFKFWEPRVAADLCGVPDYPQRAREALREMQRQVGDLAVDSDGVAQRGLLIRHLVMPDGLAGTSFIMHFIATEISRNAYVNIMSQYHPCGEAYGKPGIDSPITNLDFMEAIQVAEWEGLTRLDDRYRHDILLEF